MRGLNWLKPPPPPEVRDDRKAERFVISVGGRRAGFAAYNRTPGEITFTHTEIEPEFEGKGIGSTLIREALAQARAEGAAVIPRCPFVRSYIERHPAELDLVPQRRKRRQLDTTPPPDQQAPRRSAKLASFFMEDDGPKNLTKKVELLLELPAQTSSEADFPDAEELPRIGSVGHVSGLDGQQFLQLEVIVGVASVRLLRTWLLARAERLKEARVVWNGREFRGYSPGEIALLIRLLKRELGNDPEDVTD